MLPYTMPNGAKNITVNEQKIATDSDKNNFFNIVFDLFPELSEFKISSPFHGAFKEKLHLPTDYIMMEDCCQLSKLDIDICEIMWYNTFTCCNKNIK